MESVGCWRHAADMGTSERCADRALANGQAPPYARRGRKSLLLMLPRKGWESRECAVKGFNVGMEGYSSKDAFGVSQRRLSPDIPPHHGWRRRT